MSKDANVGEQKGYRDMDLMDSHRNKDASGGEMINIMQDKNFDGSGKYHILILLSLELNWVNY